LDVVLSDAPALVDTVVKLGGSLLADVAALDAVLAIVAAAPRTRLIVPGGGPFADAVRDVDRRIRLADAAAHWMAVLAMDQYAHLIAARMPAARLVEERAEISAAVDEGRVPVLAPSRWLRSADPLPHSWDVTSDSIAAWVAGRVGARRLVLVKPSGAGRHASVVDPYFSTALPPGLMSTIVAADELDALRSAL
jgi:5-(aminomethyl)-3-furanmethanol phosphate kinase